MFCKVLILVVVLFVSAFCDELKLVLLHNNDMHSRFEETSKNSGTCKESNKNVSCYGGFARTAHVIRNFRQQANEGKIPPVLYLNAGDTYTGTSWYSVHKWKICADFMNILKPDAMSLGNHEFDNGPQGLLPFLEHIQFPMVSANIDLSQEPELQRIKKSVVLEKDGRKIGVIGYLTNETIQISQTRGVIFEDEIAAINKEAEYLEQIGVNIIIAVGHSGFLKDQEIAAHVPAVDVVIGGHTNTFLWTGKAPDAEKPEGVYPKVVTQKSGKRVPVVQAYAYTKYMGVLNVTFDDNGDLIKFEGQPLLLDHKIPQEQDVLLTLEPYREEINKLNKLIVGKTKVLLDGDANVCRRMECNFGNLITDAFVEYVATLSAGKYWTKAPIGLVNGGGIRNSIDPAIHNGDITRAELLGVLPFDNNVLTMELTGADLLRTLEIGARSKGETSRGEFLQVSGIRYVVDYAKPPMSRIVSAKVRCSDCFIPRYQNIDLKKNYTIVTYSFLAEGGDGHTILKNRGFNKKYEDINDVDVVTWFIKKQTPVFPEVEERITVFHLNPGEKSSSNIIKINVFNVLSLAIVTQIYRFV